MNDRSYKDRYTAFVVFGITGDLARKKIIPALLDLFSRGCLPRDFRVIGYAHSEYTDLALREHVREVIEDKGHDHESGLIDKFVASFTYHRGSFDQVDDYTGLSKALIDLEERSGQCVDRIIHLAVPPKYYEDIFHNLADSGLSLGCTAHGGNTRLLVEKPFGNDLKSAQELDELLGKLFKEEQIYRIDHYLAKESLQNILAFRFSNSLFESLWNKDHIEKIEVYFKEEHDLESRGGFYDRVGALRDVGQNHMLQMLAAVTMEKPPQMAPEDIRSSRHKLLSQLAFQNSPMVRAQYEGYRDTPGVENDSEIETYFELGLLINSERFEGVPVIFSGGKALPRDDVRISITFKQLGDCFCGSDHKDSDVHRNKLDFYLKPEDGIAVQFFSKRPGFSSEIEPRVLAFSHDNDSTYIPDAYERVLYDCYRGDQTLFASTKEVLTSWAIVSPVLDKWPDVPLEVYEKGSTPLVDK